MENVRATNQYSVVFNGDIFSLKDAQAVQQATNINGVMSARGLLKNPALFAGYDTVPSSCLKRFLQIAINVGDINFQLLHNHFMFMLHPPVLEHADLVEFASLCTVSGIVDFFRDRGIMD